MNKIVTSLSQNLTKTNGVKQVQDPILLAKIKNYVSKICSSDLHLSALETKGARVNANELSRAMDDIKYIFDGDGTDILLKLTKENHPNSREILKVGGMFHSYSGNNEKAIEFYTGLVDYYKQYGRMDKAEEYLEIIKKLQQ